MKIINRIILQKYSPLMRRLAFSPIDRLDSTSRSKIRNSHHFKRPSQLLIQGPSLKASAGQPGGRPAHIQRTPRRGPAAQLKIYAGPRGLIAIVVRMVCRSLRTGRDRKGHGLGSPKAERFFQTSIETASLSFSCFSVSLVPSQCGRNRTNYCSIARQRQKRYKAPLRAVVRISLLLGLANNGRTHTVGSFTSEMDAGYRLTRFHHRRFSIAFKVTALITSRERRESSQIELQSSRKFRTLSL